MTDPNSHPFAPIAEVAEASGLLAKELRVAAEMRRLTEELACAGPCAGDAPCEFCAEFLWAGVGDDD
jgi:hypothetical protein